MSRRKELTEALAAEEAVLAAIERRRDGGQASWISIHLKEDAPAGRRGPQAYA